MLPGTATAATAAAARPTPALEIARFARLAGPILAGLLSIVVLLLRAYTFAPHPADEGIYFYQATRILDGVWPYRDFFHAHPPLHLLIDVSLIGVFGYSLPIAKAATFLAATFQGVAAYLVTRQVFRHLTVPVREAAGLFALLLLMFAESGLKAAASDTGICQASAFVALATLLLVYQRPLASGLAAACAPLVLVQSAPAALVVVLAAFLQGRRAGIRSLVGAASLWAAVHAVFLLFAGKAFIQQVYLFHLNKVGIEGEGTRQLGYVLFDNLALFTTAFAGLLALLLGNKKERILGLVAGGAALFVFIFIATRPRVFPYYYQPAFFATALLIGFGAAKLLGDLAIALHARPVRRWPGAATLVPLALMLTLPTLFAHPVGKLMSPRRIEQLATYAQTYDWIDAPGLGPVNKAVRAVFWQDGKRVPGENPNAVTQYLWQRSRWLDSHPRIVAKVAELARAQSNTTLFGDSTIVPQIAIDAGVRVTADLADTNVQRLRSGNLTIAEIVATLDAHPNALVLASAGGMGQFPEFQNMLAAHYELLQLFDSRHGPRLGLYRRRAG